MIAGQLEVVIAADVARISRDMQQVQGVIGNAMQGVQRAIAGVSSAFAALGVSLGAGALAAMGKSAIDAADHLNDLSKSTGLAVEQLSGLGIAAKQSGADLDGVANAVNKLSVNIGQHSEKFRALGVTAKDPLEAFKQLADVFSTIQDPQLRAALGAQALGKNWAAAAPLLAEGGAKIGEMVERGARLAGVTKEMAEQSDAFNDKLVLLTGTKGTLNQVVAQLLPLLNQLADQLLAAKEEAAKLGGTDFSFLLEAGKAIVVLFGNVGFVLKGVGTEIGGIAAQLAALAVGDFKRAGDISRMMKEDAKAAREAFDKWEASIMALGKSAAVTTKQIDMTDQATRRMVSDAEAAARAFIETEKKVKGAKDTLKIAGDAMEHVVAWMKEMERLAAADAKALAEFERGIQQLTAALAHNIEVVSQAIEREKLANETRGMTRSEIEAVTIARLEERLEIMRGVEGADANIKALEVEITKRKELRGVIGQGEVEEAQRRATTQALNDQARAWDEFADRVVHNLDDMEGALKDFVRELLMLVGKRWILQIGASITGNPLLAAGQAGGSSLAGSALGMAGNLLGSTAMGAAGSTFFSAATGSFMGPTMAGTAAGMGSAVYGAMMAIPVWGWIVGGLAVIAGILSRKGGGPKDEGENTSVFGSDGRLISSSASGFNISGSSADPAMAEFTAGVGRGFFEMLRAFGGTTGGVGFGGSIVRDPRGTSPTFVDTSVTDAAGNVIFSQHNANVGRSDEELQTELTLQSQRAIIAALQASDLPPMIASVFATINAQTATLEEINAAMTEAQQLQQTFAAFENAFSTPAEKLAAAQRTVTEGFAKLGLDAPKDMESFKAMVRKAWADGDKELFQKLVALAPAFAIVADAAQSAADALIQSFGDVQTELDRILGRSSSGDLSGMMGQFAEAHTWARGMDAQAFARAIADMTQEQWDALTDADRDLITAILRLIPSVDENTAAVQQMAAIYLPEVGAQGLAGTFDQQMAGIIGAQPDLMSKLSLTGTLIANQIEQWRAAQVGLSEYSAEWQTLQNAIDGFTARQVRNSADIARLTILEAQYGKEKAEQLFELEKWRDAQALLLAGNTVALDALDEIFQRKWKEILDGVASQADGAREGLRDWWNGLFQNEQLSPLTTRQKFDVAKSDYEKTLALAQSGDAAAIAKLSGSAQTYLELARLLFGSSADYVAIFRTIADQTGKVAGVTQADINAKLFNALPTSSPMASSADISGLRDEVRNLQTQLATMTLKVQDVEVKEGVERIATATEVREGVVT